MSVGIDLKKTILRSKNNYLRWNLFLIPEKRSLHPGQESLRYLRSLMFRLPSLFLRVLSLRMSPLQTLHLRMLSLQKLLLRILPL